MNEPIESDNPDGAAALSPQERARGRLFLRLAVAGAGVVMAMQMGLNANFMADDIGVSGLQLGMLEAIRETCGITALGVLALLAGLAEPVVGAVMLLLFAFGVGGYAFVPNYTWVVLVSIVWSQGLHVWMPLPRSMAMGLAEPDRAGHRLGQVHAAGSAGFGIGLVAAYALTRAGVAMRPLYLVAGAVGVVAAGMCLGIPRRIKTPGPRLVFRRRYGLFYLLSFLEGWRKQIFVCFAGFLLVRVHGTKLETMLLLWCVVQAIGYVAAPAVGRLIDRVGERRVLVFYFASLTLFFLGYAVVRSKWALYALFVMDSAFFVFAMALSTYANRLAPAAERTPTLSMGVAMNHVAAVAMPFVGGILWAQVGYRWVFVAGAVAAFVSIGVALRVPQRAVAAP